MAEFYSIVLGIRFLEMLWRLQIMVPKSLTCLPEELEFVSPPMESEEGAVTALAKALGQKGRYVTSEARLQGHTVSTMVARNTHSWSL